MSPVRSSRVSTSWATVRLTLKCSASALALATKLLRTYTMQTEALAKLMRDAVAALRPAGVNAQTHVIIWADSNNPIYRGELGDA
jgi:hypothetical protein